MRSEAFQAWIDAAASVPIADLAASRGLRLRGGVERVGPCPACGGHDRFALNTHKRIFGCRGCGAGGNVIDLVRLLDGGSFLAACQSLTGLTPPGGGDAAVDLAALATLAEERAARARAQEAEADRFRERERRRLFRWWGTMQPPAGTAVDAYLRLRGLALPPLALTRTPRLRLEPEARLYADGTPQAAVLHAGPAMVAPITGPEGRFAGLHLTWIDLSARDGKVRILDPETGELVPAKKVRGSAGAGRIVLVDPPDPRRLVIGEGTETVLSVWQAERKTPAGGETAYWSAISLNNLGGPHAGTVAHPTLRDAGGRPRRVLGPTPHPTRPGIPVPNSVAEIVLLGDGDSDPVAVAAALQRADARWSRPGRAIRAAMAPDGSDFNTLLRGLP